MPAFKRFGPADQNDSVLIVHPRYLLASGSQGWRGSPEGSSSLSLYGGARRRLGTFSGIEYQSFAPNASQTGSPRRGFPLTASVSVAFARNEALGFSQVTSARWGEEHWDVLQRLYQDYRAVSPEYTTSSYDYYCVYFRGSSTNRAGTITAAVVTGSFTMESWVKPFVTASQDFYTIQALGNGGISLGVGLGITGSNGTLMVRSNNGNVTSSVGMPIRRWNHVACVFTQTDLNTGAGTASLYLNQRLVGTGITSFGVTSIYSIGSIDGGVTPGPGVAGQSFDGLIGESRLWGSARTWTEMSSTLARQLTRDEIAAAVSYFSPREGPQLNTLFNGTVAHGSASMDLSSLARGNSTDFFSFNGFDDRVGPVWHPSDNVLFRPPKRLLDATSFLMPLSGAAVPNSGTYSPYSKALVIDVPSAFYGRQISPGSVRLTCRAYEQFGFVRTLVDDGRGGLYISGSVCSSSLADREEYTGVRWNKVGNVFYGEGLIVIRDPAMLDFGRDDGAFLDPTSTLSVQFDGDTRVPVKTLMCRVDHGEFNCTNNPTFFTTGSAGERLRRHASGSIRATTVGIYNSDRELVAVARMAEPVRIRPRDRINIRVRMDF